MNTNRPNESGTSTATILRRDPRGFVVLMGLLLVGATVTAVITMQIAAQYHLQIP